MNNSRVNNSCSSLSRWWIVLLQVVCFLCLITNAWVSSPDAQAMANQLPERHAIMRVITDDLSMDGCHNALVIARHWDEATNRDAPRSLLMFLRQPDSNLKRVARADGVIACRNGGGLAGDPWRRDHQHRAFITVQRDAFTVAEFAGSSWRGWRIITFRYDPQTVRWLLESFKNKVLHVDHVFPAESSAESSTVTRRDFGLVPLEQFGISRGCWA